MSQTPNYPSLPSPDMRPKGMAVASMVLGIISLALFCVWYVSVPCSIVGLILGFVAKGKAARGEAGGGGMATAGIICSIIGLVLALLIIILAIAGIAFMHSHPNAFQIPQPAPQPAPVPYPATAP